MVSRRKWRKSKGRRGKEDGGRVGKISNDDYMEETSRLLRGGKGCLTMLSPPPFPHETITDYWWS